MKNNYWRSSLTFLALLMVPLAVFAEGPQHGGSINVSLYHEVVTCDPHVSASYVDKQILQNIYNTLIGYDNDLNIIPELAESWDTPDPVTYIFHLRKGVKFHDGTDLDAEAVKWNIDRVLDPKTKSRGRGEINAIKSVEVVDSHTVKMNLSYPFSPLLAGLTDRAGFIISPTAFEKMGADKFASNPVGSGPFEFMEWKRDDHLTLKRFEGYWEKGLPYLDRIVFKPIPDQAVKLTNLKSGALDIIDDVMPRDVESVKKDKKLVLLEVPSYGVNALRLNCTKPPFNNKALRQAVAYAIDRESIWKHIFYASGVVGHGPIAPVSWAYSKEAFRYTYDPKKAKEKLIEGGKPNGFKFTMITKISALDVQVAQAMQAQLKAVGIDVNIVQAEGARHFKVMLKKTYEGNYGLWSGYPEPDTNLYRQHHPKGTAKWTGYADARVAELLDKSRASLDVKKRKEYYAKALDILIKDAPQVWVYYFPRRNGLNAKVKNYMVSPDGKMRLKEVWLSK